MRRVVPPLIVLCLGFAPAPVYREKRDTRTDLEKMQGKWYRVYYSVGQERIREPAWETALTITGRLAVFSRIGERRPKAPFGIAASQARNGIDLLLLEGKGGSAYGIYRLEGDTLTWCYNARTRPKGFDKPGQDDLLMVFERPKP